VEQVEGTEPHVDFDLHGIVGIRVLDARRTDVDTLTRQLSPLTAPLAREPDITVRFVDELDEARPMTYATWPNSAGTEDTFYLLRGKDGVAVRTRFPMDDVGDRCEIVCERRAGHVPHLLAVINMTALRRGVLPLHASAFTYRGVGVLATGWGKGGKTETLLAFAARGARYVGDEWVYLTPDGGMHGVPEPIRLWNWHIEQLPELRASLPVATRARLRSLPAVASSAAGLSARLRGLPASVLRRTAPVLRRQAFVQVPRPGSSAQTPRAARAGRPRAVRGQPRPRPGLDRTHRRGLGGGAHAGLPRGGARSAPRGVPAVSASSSPSAAAQ
jgi:hypothetical protein